MRTIVTSLSLFLPFLDLFAALCGNGMLESMLEPHLKETGAGTVDTGISFLVFGCMYMFGNLLFGAVNNYRESSHSAILTYRTMYDLHDSTDTMKF